MAEVKNYMKIHEYRLREEAQLQDKQKYITKKFWSRN
jgi:hypothetical protein